MLRARIAHADIARELKRAGRSERFIANELGISPATAHRYLTE